jgi:phosphoglucosamine mutase
MSGILPSPAVSHLVRLHQLDLGAAISASHNPPQDNGIKFYSPNGLKLSEPEEDMVEALLDGAHPPGRIGSVFPWPEAFDLYLEFLMKAAGDISLTGVRIALDCAHGATFSVAPKLYAAQGRGYP